MSGKNDFKDFMEHRTPISFLVKPASNRLCTARSASTTVSKIPSRVVLFSAIELNMESLPLGFWGTSTSHSGSTNQFVHGFVSTSWRRFLLRRLDNFAALRALVFVFIGGLGFLGLLLGRIHDWFLLKK